MRFKLFLAFLFLFLVPQTFINAQKKITDSLERELIQPTNGLSKVEILNELSWYYAHSNIKKGIERADLAITLARDQNDSLELGIAYERKGYNYQSLGKDSLTLTYYSQAEKVYTEIKHNKRLAALTFNKGNFYFFRSDYLNALDQSEKALELYRVTKDSVKMSRIFNQIALSHLYLGNYTLSMQTFQKGLLFLELTENKKSQFYGQILGNLALLYEKLSEFEKALEMQNKVLAIHQNIEYEVGISNTYANIGKLFGRLNQHDKSLKMLKLSLEIQEKSGNKYRIANGKTNLGIAYYALNDYQNAIKNLTLAKLLYEELNHHSNLSTVHKNLGDIYMDTALPRNALTEFKIAIEYAKKSNDVRAEYLAKESQSKALFQTKKYREAYTAQQQSIALKDSIISYDKRDELVKLEAKYLYEKDIALLEKDFEKSKAIDEAEKQKNKAELAEQRFQNTLWLSLSGFMLIGGGLIFYLLKQRHKKEKFQEVYSTEKRISKKVHDELANDIYGVMTQMEHSKTVRKEATLDALEDIYNRTRDISHETGSVETQNYEGQLKSLLSQFRSDKTTIVTRGLGEIQWNKVAHEKKIVLYRVLNELLVNMKKHSEATLVSFVFSSSRKALHIVYSDNGKGVKTPLEKGFGLSNTETRIKKIDGTFSFESEIGKGVRIDFSFPQ